MTRRFGVSRTEVAETNEDESGFSRVRTGAMTSVPPKEENVETALAIPNENSRFCVEMFFAFHNEFDIEQLACKGIERPSYNPIDVEPVTGQGHARSNDHAPYRTESEGGVINDDTKIIPCGWVCVGGIFEDEVWDGDVCEWLEKCGDDPHPEYPREFEGWWRSSSSSVEGKNYRLKARLAVATVRIYSGSLLPFLATTVYPTASPHQSPR